MSTLTPDERRTCAACGALLGPEPDVRVRYRESQRDASGHPHLQAAAVLGKFKCRRCGAWSQYPLWEVRPQGNPGEAEKEREPEMPITTEQVWQLIADAAHSPLSREQVIEQLILALRRQLQYLSYRQRRGRQTAYDEVASQDVEALTRAIWLLQEKAE
jgi:RNase P subunit RPR2